MSKFRCDTGTTNARAPICSEEILLGKNLFTGYLTGDENDFVGEQYRYDFWKSLKVFRNFVHQH